MKFSFDAIPFFSRVTKDLKNHFILLGIMIGIELLFTGSIGFLTLTGFLILFKGFLIAAFSFHKFHIQTFIIDGSRVSMKVYRFNKLVLDTDRTFELKELKMEQMPSSVSYGQKNQVLKIKVTDELKFWQLNVNGWTKENFDEIMAYVTKANV